MSKLMVDYQDGNMRIESHGDLLDNVKDVCLVIGSMYHSMKKSRPVDAMLFRAAVTNAVNDKSVVWERIPDEGVSLDIPTK